MSVSVIVSNFNGARFLPKLIGALSSQREVETEIIVVDRNSRDESRALLAQHSQIRVLSEPPETGLVSGYAAGAKVATAEHLFFCNEDLWFEDDCLQRLERQIDPVKGIVAADPWQWTYDGKVWIHGGVRFRPARWDFSCAYPFRSPDYTARLRAGERIPYPCAGAFLMHRRSYEEIGGWDTTFFLDLEDVDLGIRIWQRGWSIVTVPGAKVFHAVNVSNQQTLTRVKQTVAKRRYVSGLASQSIIALKYYSTQSLGLAPATVLAALLKDLLRGRWTPTLYHFQVVRQIFARFGAAWKFRLRNRAFNRASPGERFFTAPGFASDPAES